MKNVFILLLFAALGAAAYFYFSKNKNKSIPDSTELIVGKWQVDTVDMSKSKDSTNDLSFLFMIRDSNGGRLAFDFLKNGIILDNMKKFDTSFYEIQKQKELLVWAKGDSSKTKLSIQKLDSAQLVLQDKDSAVISFRKSAP